MQDLANKYRQARKGNTELVVVEGAHAIKHALRFGAEFIHIARLEVSEALDVLEEFGTPEEVSYVSKHSEVVSECLWSELAPNPPDTGIIALAKRPSTAKDFTGETVVFIENPHSLFNVGAIIRTAVAAGVTSFAMSGRHNIWHADCVSTARGLNFALEYVNVITNKELEQLAKAGGYTMCTLEVGGDNITSADLPQKKVLVFGTERDGISQELSDMATKHLALPMREGVSSLNLASSVAATLYSL